MLVDITGKVIVVTGASRGIGRELALCLAKEGARVVINYNKNETGATGLLDEICEYNNSCITVKADVTNKREVQNMCKKTLEAFGKIDALINNAGIVSDNRVPMLTEKQWRNVVNVNLTGTFFCCSVFGKEMMKQHYGKIINVASLKGQLGSEGQANYSASKAGVIGLTKALAKELGEYNVAVNAVCPGYIKTDLNRRDELKQKIASRMALLEGCALRDFLNAMVYFVSDSIQSVSGRVFLIDSRLG